MAAHTEYAYVYISYGELVGPFKAASREDAIRIASIREDGKAVSRTVSDWNVIPDDKSYPPNTLCVCGDLIHPDMPLVEVEADGGLFHWNADGGGHRATSR